MGLGGFFKGLGKWALRAAPIVAAPFTGGASLLAIGAGSGAALGAMGGGGWKGALLGGGLGAIPGGGGTGGLAKGAIRPALSQGLKQAATNFGKQTAIGYGTQLASKALPGAAGQVVGQYAGNIFSNAMGKGGVQMNSFVPTQQQQGGWGNFFKNTLPQVATNVATGQYGRTPQSQNPYILSATGQQGGGGQQGQGGGFWDKWGPAIALGGGAAAGAVIGRQSQKNALQRTPEELAALGGEQMAAGSLSRYGNRLLQSGIPQVQTSANYYDALLRGNRAAQSQVLAPAVAGITDQYRGAQRGLEQSGLRGAARDFASGELNRQRASQLGALTAGVQPFAAGALTEIGQESIRQGSPMFAQAGNLYANMLGQGYSNRQYSRWEGEKTARGVGELTAEMANYWKGRQQPAGQPPRGPVRGPNIQVGGMPPGQTTSLPPYQQQPPDFGGWNPGGRRQTSPGQLPNSFWRTPGFFGG